MSDKEKILEFVNREIELAEEGKNYLERIRGQTRIDYTIRKLKTIRDFITNMEQDDE